MEMNDMNYHWSRDKHTFMLIALLLWTGQSYKINQSD